MRTLREHGPLLLVALTLAGLIAHAARFWWFTIDDAAISFAYAENLAHGHGLVLTRLAAPVEGFSNPLWVVALTGPAALGLDLELVAKTLGLACAAGAAPLLYEATRRAGAGRWLAVLGPALLAAFTGYALWAEAGLENGAVGLAVAAAAFATLRELDDAKARPWSALPLGLLLWLRPEAPLLVALMLAARAGFVALRRLPLRREAWLAGWLVAAGVSLALLRWHYFGELYPNTYFAKLASRSGQAARGRAYVRDFLGDYRLWLLAWAPPGAWLIPRARPALALALAVLVGSLGFAWYAGGDWAHGHRFMTPALVALALLVPLGLAGLAQRVPLRWRNLSCGLAALLVLAAAAVPAAARQARIWDDPQFSITVAERGDECHELAGLGRWLLLDRPLALEVDVGGMAYCGELELLDWVGLADWTLARLGPAPAARREYLNQRSPDLGLGRGEVPPALAGTPEQDTSYLAVHRRGWHPRLSLWLRRDSVLAPFALPAHLGREVAPGIILEGARVEPAAVGPGQPALVTASLLVRARPARWPTLAIDVVSDAGQTAQVTAEALPSADGLSPLSPGDVVLVRARVTLPPGAHSVSLRAAGVLLATLLRGPPAEVTEATELERRALADAARLGDLDPAFATRRLLLARYSLARLRARARLLEAPLPAGIGDDLQAALADLAERLAREAAELTADAAYARLRLANRAAPGRADLVRALAELRSRRRRRYSALEPLLAIDLERAVALGSSPDQVTALAAVYLDDQRDADVLALVNARPHGEPALGCLAAMAAANLGLEPPPPERCAAHLDPERARYQPDAPDPDLGAGGFEGTLAPWVPEGLPARVVDNSAAGPAELATRWSGDSRALTAGAGPGDRERAHARGRITSPTTRIRHRYLSFWLGCHGVPGRGWEHDLSARLLVGGQPVLVATPSAGQVRRVVWDLGPWLGQPATVELVDASTDAWLEADAVTWLGALP